MLKKVPIASLNLAKYNPVSRQKDCSALVKSIEAVGLLYPVLVTEKNELVDGHRRVAACKKLGWTDIPTLIAKGNQPEMFAAVNSTVRGFSGNQTLHVYLEEPLAVGNKARNRLVELEELVGRAILRRMAKEGFSLATWSTCKRIASGADQSEPETLVMLLKWMMHFGCAGIAKRAIQNGTPPGVLIAAAKKMKPIKVKFAEA